MKLDKDWVKLCECGHTNTNHFAQAFLKAINPKEKDICQVFDCPCEEFKLKK